MPPLRQQDARRESRRQETFRGYRVYRCSSVGQKGRGACIGVLEVREDFILPKIIEIMREEIGDASKLLTDPPESVVGGRGRRKDQQQQDKDERDELAKKIDTYRERAFDFDDQGTRRRWTARLPLWWRNSQS